MQPYNFLAALPALLGLAGFVLYQVLGSNKAGDDISKRVVERLRIGSTGSFPPDERLTPRQLTLLLEQEQRLREVVGEHDFRLLKQALTQQFILTVLVYVLTIGFCGWSAFLFTRPTPLPEKPVVSPGSAEVAYSVIVRDKKTNVPIRGATITLELGGAPSIEYTDSEGVCTLSVPIPMTRKGIIKVDAEGYHNYERTLSSLSDTKTEDIRLDHR